MSNERKMAVELIEKLNATMPEMRRMEKEANSLKSQIATMNAKMFISDTATSDADFARHIQAAMDAW